MADEKPSGPNGSGLSTPTLYASSERSSWGRSPSRVSNEAAPSPADPDRLQRWVFTVSVIAVVAVIGILAGALALIAPSRDTGPQNTVGAQWTPPKPSGAAPTQPSPTSAPAKSAAPPAASSRPAESRPPATNKPPRAAAPTVAPDLTIGSTIGLQVEGKPGLLVRHHEFVARVDQLSSTSSALDKAESRFIVRKGLAFDSCVSFEAVDHPGFYLRRFFSDLLLHKQENGDIYRQETTFCPVPARNGTALTLLVLFPSGFAVTTAPDGRLRLESADQATPTGFIVRKPL
jgi:hypothetical protein